MIEEEKQQKYLYRDTTRSLMPYCVSDQDATKQQKRQPSKPTRASSTLWKDLREGLLAFQVMDTCGKIIIGILVALIVGGIITLFILIALLPNASIGINALLAAIEGFLVGRASKRH